MATPLLSVRDLVVDFKTRAGNARVLDHVSLDVHAGEILGIVGESGCGKSMTALSIMGLIPSPPGLITSGAIELEGRDLVGLDNDALCKIRGKEIGMIFQEPMTSLNPVFTVGEQIAETVRLHEKATHKAAHARAVEMLKSVEIPEAETRAHAYPHQLSGGMRQRVMIAMALACRPRVLIADEPTTALDTTVQAQIFDLLQNLQDEMGTAIIMITHDMGAIAELADTVAVMYAGRVVEMGKVDAVLSRPDHPYTQGLITCVPHLSDTPSPVRERLMEIPGVVPALTDLGNGCAFAPRCNQVMDTCRSQKPPLTATQDAHKSGLLGDHSGDRSPMTSQDIALRVEDLKVHFGGKTGFFKRGSTTVHAVDGVSFEVPAGTTFGIVGESGSGKSTTALAIMRLVHITDGKVTLRDTPLSTLEGEALRDARSRFQIVFQDPYSSLDPRKRAGVIVREPLDLMKIGTPAERRAKVSDLFAKVGLRPEQQELFPHQFSGGQRQRLGLARALSTEPELIVCDEPVSALDVAIQAQILNLMADLQKELGLTYLFISHDLGVVQHICDVVAVMYLGQIVEIADRVSLFTNPRHPYTKALLAAVPSVHGKKTGRRQARIRLQGDPPSPINLPKGCRFASRCPIVQARCSEAPPPLEDTADGHKVACFLA